ncbi:MAG: deoxyribodipyrimidine photo-lyase, partial [Bdellovibrionaceae bacterium]|nr:deoxyribodipyrimidine photo-lyase [Pseudobdellovibrionaceae bacterium]
MKYEKSLYWMRRDLRLTDNKALFYACKNSKKVYITFIFDINILNKLKNKKDSRVEFIFNSLLAINQQLKKQNSQLIILHGNPVELIPSMTKKLNFSAVFVNEDYENYAKKRDQMIHKKLNKQKVSFLPFKDHVIFKALEISKKDGTAYRVFTPYKKIWLKNLQSDKHLKKYDPNLKKLSSYKNKIPKIEKLEDLDFQKT